MKRAKIIETTIPAFLTRLPRYARYHRHVFAVLGFLALSPIAQSVVPPPDGGYPNFTTAEGQNALLNLTSGLANTAVGSFSLESVTIGSFNTGVGADTLALNTGDDNTATGAAALLLNTTGSNNTADGTATLVNNSTGEDNTAVGAFALNSNTASGNTAIGSNALLRNRTGGTLDNILGFEVGPNVAVGQQALENNTVASANTALGFQALHRFTTGPPGNEQLGICTAVGFQALGNATGGFGNSGFGYRALKNNTDGALNTAIGVFALEENTTGDNNTVLGDFAGSSVTTASNVICIGALVAGENVSNSCYIGSIFGEISSGGTAVSVNADGKLGTTTSSRRFKEEIKPMERSSEALFALKPVTFRYKSELDPQGISQFGLVAEDVEAINPDLVVRDKEGKVNTVRYEAVNAMLLNEFLKEHKAFVEERKRADAQDRKMREQETTIAALKSNIAQQCGAIQAVTAQLKEQATQIQTVNAQLKLSRAAPLQAALVIP